VEYETTSDLFSVVTLSGDRLRALRKRSPRPIAPVDTGVQGAATAPAQD
jgi:hypothetical protein